MHELLLAEPLAQTKGTLAADGLANLALDVQVIDSHVRSSITERNGTSFAWLQLK